MEKFALSKSSQYILTLVHSILFQLSTTGFDNEISMHTVCNQVPSIFTGVKIFQIA